jgi:hypothetical protein
MTKPCRQIIVEAALATLATIPVQETASGAYKEVTVEPNRRVPLEETDLPSVGLFEGDETTLNDFSSIDVYELRLLVQIAARGSGAAAVEFVNALRAEAIKALKTDITLGGLARWLELTDAGDFLGAEASAETEGALLAFTIHYATREGDPFTFDF